MSRFVLVIDDDEIVRHTVQQILQGENYDVVSAADGKKGMQLFRALQPDLVITDIIMPEQEGIETILQMRTEQPDAKIIAISGGARIGNADFLAIARKLGACDGLAKPFDPDDLVASVQKCMNASR